MFFLILKIFYVSSSSSFFQCKGLGNDFFFFNKKITPTLAQEWYVWSNLDNVYLLYILEYKKKKQLG
jgi:hypothetical protein